MSEFSISFVRGGQSIRMYSWKGDGPEMPIPAVGSTIYERGLDEVFVVADVVWVMREAGILVEIHLQKKR